MRAKRLITENVVWRSGSSQAESKVWIHAVKFLVDLHVRIVFHCTRDSSKGAYGRIVILVLTHGIIISSLIIVHLKSGGK